MSGPSPGVHAGRSDEHDDEIRAVQVADQVSLQHAKTIHVASKATNVHPRPSESASQSDHDSTSAPAEKQPRPHPIQTTTTTSTAPQVHSVFSKHQKRFIVFMASWAGFFSTISANIYFPALNPLAKDLGVSDTLINLTLSSYMIFQGLAPVFMGNLADTAGRRPAYIICFIIYIAANVGLALQDSYAALFILRALQSTGSSPTIPMSSGIVGDVATASERGKYMGISQCGSLIGPAIGPVIGGLLAQYLGWRAIFWFLAIMAAVFTSIFLIFFPETARTKVGNGSIPPSGWNMSLTNYLAVRKAGKVELDKSAAPTTTQELHGPKHKFRFPNPNASLRIIRDKEVAVILFYNAFLFAAFYDLAATIPSQFKDIFDFDDLRIGLCFIPFGVGAMVGTFMNGLILDRNFQRWSRKLGVTVRKGIDTDLRTFPVEKARLELAIPAIYLACILLLVWGWVLQHGGPLAVLLVLLFLCAFTMTIAFNVVFTLLIDFYPKSPATAAAANNLVRCLLGAGATALVLPMIDGMGRGWTFTFLSLFLLVTSPLLWVIYFKGMEWREQRETRERRREIAKQRNNTADTLESGRLEVVPSTEISVPNPFLEGAGRPDLEKTHDLGLRR